MDNTTSSLNKWTKKKIIFIVGSFLLFGMVVLLISGGEKSPKTSQEEQKQNVNVGQEGLLRVEGQNEVLVATSKENLKKLTKAAVAKDTIGMAQMVQSGEAFFVDIGTKVLVIGSAFGSREIRIVDGQHATRSGWVPLEFIVASK